MSVRSRRTARPLRHQGGLRGQRGFLLVLTIWILAAVAIAAAYFGSRVQRSIQLATQRQDQLEALQALANARQEALYRLAVMPMSMHGLGRPPLVVRLDGQSYTEGNTTLQLQDVYGLVDLNSFSDDSMQRLLRGLGVPQDRIDNLIDSLRDYVDDDDLRRLNGAEREQYERAGLETRPANAPLASTPELRQVYGWKDVPQLWAPGGILDHVTVGGGTPINPNTASERVLTVLPTVEPAAAQAIVKRREVEPITAGWLDRMLGTALEGPASRVIAFPAHAVRVTQTSAALPWGLRYTVAMTPQGATPWQIVGFHRFEVPHPGVAPPNEPQASSPPHAAPLASLPPRPAAAAETPVLAPR